MDDEGYVYVATTCTSEEDGKDIVLLKYAPEIGEAPLFAVQYNGLGDEDDIATGIVIDSSGHFYVCGTSEGSGTGKDVFLRKYASSDGAPIWTARYNSGGDNDDYATDKTLDSSGNLLICGTIDDEAELDGLVIVYEPAATIKDGWPVWYDPAFQLAEAVTQSPPPLKSQWGR